MTSYTPNDSQNPWEDEPGQHTGFQNHNPYHAYQDQTRASPQRTQPHTSYQASPPRQPNSSYQPETTPQEYHPPSYPPPHAQPSYSTQSHQTPFQQTQDYQPPARQSNHAAHAADLNDEQPPSLPPRRTATDLALPTGQDRTHQIEVMQSYQAAGRKNEHDMNIEILQREFPSLDGSLIAAIYGDSQSLSATREMLGELAD